MFEAMAAGTPVVLAADGEASAMLARAAGGIAVPPGDADALAAAIAHLALNPRERVRMGASAQRFVATGFSRTRWADRYCSLLGRISETAADARPVSSAAVGLGN
jgi:glycosyltransferase involved in cell wall biosynthesis